MDSGDKKILSPNTHNRFCSKTEEAHKLHKELYDKNPENYVYTMALVACESKFWEFWQALPPKWVSCTEKNERGSSKKTEDASTSRKAADETTTASCSPASPQDIGLP